jgi:hypothetical protein
MGFEPAIPASERPQTHALDRVATGIGVFGLPIYLSGLVTAVAVFRNPNTIPFCLTSDLLLNVLFSWLFVQLPSTFFLDVLFFFFPLGCSDFNS